MSRKTRQKETILRILRANNCHPTAGWIYEQVKQELPHISLGTVYRDLKALKQAGEIAELGLAGRLGRFDGNNRNHYHFQCQKCGRIFDIAQPVSTELDNQIAGKTGFDVLYHHLEFYGLCLDCKS